MSAASAAAASLSSPCRMAPEKVDAKTSPLGGGVGVGAHAIDANRYGGGEVESDEFHSLADYIAVASGGEALVFELLHDALRLKVRNAGRAHEGGRPHKPRKLVGAEEDLFEVRLRRNVIADAPAVAHDGADVGGVHTFGEQFGFGVSEMLLGEMLVVVVVEIADGSPVFDLVLRLSEVARKGLHAATDVRGVDDEMRVIRCAGEQFLCA